MGEPMLSFPENDFDTQLLLKRRRRTNSTTAGNAAFSRVECLIVAVLLGGGLVNGAELNRYAAEWVLENG
jgi:hypothetical protein